MPTTTQTPEPRPTRIRHEGPGYSNPPGRTVLHPHVCRVHVAGTARTEFVQRIDRDGFGASGAMLDLTHHAVPSAVPGQAQAAAAAASAARPLPLPFPSLHRPAPTELDSRWFSAKYGPSPIAERRRTASASADPGRDPGLVGVAVYSDAAADFLRTNYVTPGPLRTLRRSTSPLGASPLGAPPDDDGPSFYTLSGRVAAGSPAAAVRQAKHQSTKHQSARHQSSRHAVPMPADEREHGQALACEIMSLVRPALEGLCEARSQLPLSASHGVARRPTSAPNRPAPSNAPSNAPSSSPSTPHVTPQSAGAVGRAAAAANGVAPSEAHAKAAALAALRVAEAAERSRLRAALAMQFAATSPHSASLGTPQRRAEKGRAERAATPVSAKATPKVTPKAAPKAMQRRPQSAGASRRSPTSGLASASAPRPRSLKEMHRDHDRAAREAGGELAGWGLDQALELA